MSSATIHRILGSAGNGSNGLVGRPMTLVSMPLPEMFLPICSTISTSIGENGSLAIHSRALFSRRRSPSSRSRAPNASMTAVSSYPFSTMPSPKPMRAFPILSRPRRAPAVAAHGREDERPGAQVAEVAHGGAHDRVDVGDAPAAGAHRHRVAALDGQTGGLEALGHGPGDVLDAGTGERLADADHG